MSRSYLCSYVVFYKVKSDFYFPPKKVLSFLKIYAKTLYFFSEIKYNITVNSI